MSMKTLRALSLTLMAAACITAAQAQGLRPEIGPRCSRRVSC